MTEIEATKELADRELARRHLLYFLRYTFPGFQDIAYQGSNENKVHIHIIDALQKVESGQIKRLIINCPPRLGKSIITSQYFASWFLGRSPKKKIIQASYGADLSNDFGRKTKQIAQSQEYKNVFPDFELAKDKREGGNRETDQGGGYYSVGVGGATTGKGADLLIIDDPVKDRVEADSEIIQKRNIEWYDSVAATRLQSQDSAIILIMTRWSVGDLGGYIESEEDGWHKVIIQAIDEDGNEIIRPGKWDKGYMQSLKDKMIPKNREALYQQDPIASTDSIFKQEYFDYFLLSDFERVDAILKKQDLRCGLFIDPAFSSSTRSDDAVILGIGEHNITKHKYLIDGYASTSAPSRTLEAMVVMYNKMKSDGFIIKFISVESVSINKDQTKFVEDLRAKLLEYGINCPVHTYEPKIKKEDRIKFNLEAPMSQKGLKINRNISDKSFISRMESQFLQFPNGKHDDIMDTVSQAFEVFGKTGEVQKPLVSKRNGF